MNQALRQILFLASILAIVYGCRKGSFQTNPELKYIQVAINEDNTTPTVDIRSFILVTNNTKGEEAAAREIMKVKRKLPLAMQGKDSVLFNEILARNFTFRAEDEFFNRADYIEARVTGTWTIDTVKYENLTLQFFGEKAIVTYRNILNGTDDSGEPDIEYYSWVDVYTKENDKWKIEGIHQIDARIEYPTK